MKFAIGFLLMCVAISCCQRLPKRQPWSLLSLSMPYYSPKAFYHMQNPYFIGLDAADSTDSLEPEFEDETSQDVDNTRNWQTDFIQSQSRTANRFRPNSNQAQQRFFFGAFNPFLNNNNNNNAYTPFWRIGSTLLTVTVSSTLTTAVVNTCVPATQFAAGAANIACARKRRNLVVAMKQFDDETDDGLLRSQVIPSRVQKVESTVVPASYDRDGRQVDFQQLVSSKDEDFSTSNRDDLSQISQRQNRALITFTTTSTSFVFTSTVIKKTINLAASTGLSCLPSGFVVC